MSTGLRIDSVHFCVMILAIGLAGTACQAQQPECSKPECSKPECSKPECSNSKATFGPKELAQNTGESSCQSCCCQGANTKSAGRTGRQLTAVDWNIAACQKSACPESNCPESTCDQSACPHTKCNGKTCSKNTCPRCTARGVESGDQFARINTSSNTGDQDYQRLAEKIADILEHSDQQSAAKLLEFMFREIESKARSQANVEIAELKRRHISQIKELEIAAMTMKQANLAAGFQQTLAPLNHRQNQTQQILVELQTRIIKMQQQVNQLQQKVQQRNAKESKPTFKLAEKHQSPEQPNSFTSTTQLCCPDCLQRYVHNNNVRRRPTEQPTSKKHSGSSMQFPLPPISVANYEAPAFADRTERSSGTASLATPAQRTAHIPLRPITGNPLPTGPSQFSHSAHRDDQGNYRLIPMRTPFVPRVSNAASSSRNWIIKHYYIGDLLSLLSSDGDGEKQPASRYRVVCNQIIQKLKQTVEPASWSDSNSLIEFSPQNLLIYVRQTHSNHQEIKSCLDAIRNSQRKREPATEYSGSFEFPR